MSLSPATTRFLAALTAQVAETRRWWDATHPDRPLDPDAATGLCGRRFPVNRQGQTHISLDERLWAAGRQRYAAPRSRS